MQNNAPTEAEEPEATPLAPEDETPPETDGTQDDGGLKSEQPPTLEELLATIKRLSQKEAEIAETKRILKKQADKMLKAL